MAVVRVLLVDDQKPFLRAMAAVVEETPGFEVVGRAVSGEEAVMLAATLLPGPRADGREPSRHRRARGDPPALAAASPATVVLLLSTYDDEAGASFVAESGAAAYVSKAAFGPDRLEEVWSRVS